ncbi:CDP-glycerol glycerophosphotransferase family protein [Moraxella marmotae]|uniref:CDP-glycerol glycerophosphotransferase family protein n=1 Tax=Moraxella marmotae TaxID=3344520 RepID=UPI0035F35E79
MNFQQKIEEKLFEKLPIDTESKKIFQRRLKKLKTDPKGFLRGSYHKRKKQIEQHIPTKHHANHNFTIVTAVYNADKYLDEFFDSIVKQSISFKEHIQIICVDDGSPDRSADIIKKWQKKYPNNIHYFYKENGGQASARNLGLQYVETEWVTFIDPDDFISADYFHKIDLMISKDKNISLVGCPLVLYFEDKKIFKDTHPLKYRFAKGNVVLPLNNLGNHLQLSASTAIFKTEKVKDNHIIFDVEMKPSFEDAKFVTNYILSSSSQDKMAFVSDISYFYRKRSDGSSTLDGAWQNPNLFSTVLEKGCISILQEAENKFGYIPVHIQRIALYHIIWYFGRIVNKSSSLSHLTNEQKDIFFNLLTEMFKYIDEETILAFNLGGAWFLHKVALLGLFKKVKPENQIAYIENVDREKKQILITYFSWFDEQDSIRLNSNDIVPVYSKTTQYDFLNHKFVSEKRYWIKFDNLNERLNVYIGGKKSRISLKGKQYKDGVLIQQILDAFKPSEKYLTDNSWLLMDRDVQADDNAEHLYRYIQKNHPNQKIYFALNKQSHDWERLAKEGFNLLDYGSKEFENKLCKVSKIISSHLDKYIYNYFGDEYGFSKKFVFLQHGITKDNMSDWFNTKKNLQCLVTATTDEYHSIADDHNNYKLTKKEVLLTGFPRHDSLLKNNQQDNKIILVMPTWRRSIVGQTIGNGNSRELNNAFMETNYAKHWYDFLHNEKLKQLAEQYGYQIIFAPHANIAPYLDMFNVPNYIQIWQAKTATTSMQQLFQNAKLMVTDYSSVAFEMALLEKTVLYYQFDSEEVFSGEHIYQAGYFSYEKNGFGPVVYTELELLSELEQTLKNNGQALEPYATRIKETFPFRDGNNCERVYQAIKNLDLDEPIEINKDWLVNAVKLAYQAQDWNLVEQRSQTLMQIQEYQDTAKELQLTALLKQRKLPEFESLLSEFDSESEVYLSHLAEYQFMLHKWKNCISTLNQLSHLTIEQKLSLGRCYAELGQVENIKNSILSSILDCSDAQKVIGDAYLLLANKQWLELANLLSDNIALFDESELKQYQAQLLLARANRELLNYEQAHQCLIDFEKHTKNDFSCRIEIAHLAFDKQDYKKCINQFNQAVSSEITYLKPNYQIQLATALLHSKQYDELAKFIDLEKDLDNQELKIILVHYYQAKEDWYSLLALAETLTVESQLSVLYPISLAKYRLGMFDKLYNNLVKPTIEHSYSYWQLISELAILMGDKDLLKYCYRGIIAIYPKENKQQYLEKLQALNWQ